MTEPGAMRVEPWGDGDGPLLARLVGDPAMMEHLGGPEPADKIADRQRRYAADGSDQYRIVVCGESVGWVGFFERTGEPDWEIGWAVVPEYQGHGIAQRATALVLQIVRERGVHRWVHAYSAVDNGASNRVCERLGFTLLGSGSFEYPVGHVMQCNDWRLELENAADS